MIQSIKRYIKKNILVPIWNNRENFNYFNQKIFFPKNSIIFKRTIEEGIYEKENLMLIKKFVKQNSTMFDIGANIGLMAIPILSMNKEITVISIEPSPNTFPFLKKTHDSNQYKNNWILVNEAISNQVGKVDFQLSTPANGAYESMLDTKRSEFINTVKVNCNTIDHIWDASGRPKVSFIKIDIEGADLLALMGSYNCINNCKPVILMEWNQTNIKPFNLANKDLLDFTDRINYQIYSLPYLNKVNTILDFSVYGALGENYLLFPNCN